MKLNQSQLDLIRLYQSQINSTRLELSHAQAKLDAFITGILTANGVEGKVTYDIQGDNLNVVVPEPVIIEE